ncbi:MAG: hypothetical protein R6U17_07825 [Thermoplasmata archaeon]
MGVVLISGQRHTLKERFVRTMCHTAGSLSPHEDVSYIFLKRYDEKNVIDRFEELIKYDINYIIVPSWEEYDAIEVDRILRLWREKEIKDKSLILIHNGKADAFINDDKINFLIDIQPLDDIEHRIEMVKRERDYNYGESAFHERFQKSEDKLISDILNAREILGRVNMAEMLSEELREELCRIFGKDDIKRPFECVSRYAHAEAAFNDRRWISREDIEYALIYLNR